MGKEGQSISWVLKENFVFSDNRLLLGLSKYAEFPCTGDFYMQLIVLTTKKLSRIDHLRSYFILPCIM